MQRARTGFFVDVGIIEDEESGNRSGRRHSNDSRTWDTRKRAAHIQRRATGPPMIIREESGMSMVSDFTSDNTQNSGGPDTKHIPKSFDQSAEFDRLEAEKRMSLIKECGSFATLGWPDGEKSDGVESINLNDKSDGVQSINFNDQSDGVHSINLNSSTPSLGQQSINLNSMTEKERKTKQKNVSPSKERKKEQKDISTPSDTYVRHLEVELINLKMQMAQAQSQIDEHKMMSNREHTTLRQFQGKLQIEKEFLQLENTRLKCELEDERENVRKMMLKIKEQDVVICHLRSNAQLTSKEKLKLLRENNDLLVQ